MRLKPEQFSQLCDDITNPEPLLDDIDARQWYPLLYDSRADYACKIRGPAQHQIFLFESKLSQAEDELLRMEFRAELLSIIETLRRTPLFYPTIDGAIHATVFKCFSLSLYYTIHGYTVRILRIYENI